MARISTLQQPIQLAVASASIAVTIYRIIIWRARTRAKKTVDRMEDIIECGGPLIDINDESFRHRILQRAIRRASTWMKLAHTQNAEPLIGQVGGASSHKKPLLTLGPEYVLKPVLTDHRGIREIAFYEAMVEAVFLSNNHHRQHSRQQAYANFLKPLNNPFSQQQQKQQHRTTHASPSATAKLLYRVREALDTLALAFALILKDKVVVASEAAVEAAWRTVKREVDLLMKLSKFTPSYYGIVGMESPSNKEAYGVTDDTHLLLSNLTENYAHPVVMDLKMGTQSYEPDAPLAKQRKEANKYPQQSLFGFRIVGMRIYQPGHPHADESGYRFFGKEYGRSLETREEVKQALRIYFGAGLETSEACFDNNRGVPTSTSGRSALTNGGLTEKNSFAETSSTLQTEKSTIASEGSNHAQDPTKQEKAPPPPPPDHPNYEEENAMTIKRKNSNRLSATATSLKPTAVKTKATSDADAKRNDNGAANYGSSSNANKRTSGSGEKGRPKVRVKSISNLLVQLRAIQRWFEDNRGLQFCASSLLLIYEGQLSCQAPDVTTLKMIDFGRVRRRQYPPPSQPLQPNPTSTKNKPQQSPSTTPTPQLQTKHHNQNQQQNHPHINAQEVGDPGYLRGLQTLQQLLIELIKEAKNEESREADDMSLSKPKGPGNSTRKKTI